ncbi:MAG: ABC transporter permease [Verrucomicrobia bacterium]|nr:ABC transporter permease [Verrucomicrobiota bacterium]
MLSLRRLLKTPGFTILAVLTLALGIGANTAIFSLVHDLFLRGLPFREPDRLVRLYSEAKDRNIDKVNFSVPRFKHFRENQKSFDGFIADTGAGFNLTGLGEPVQIIGFHLSRGYFQTLGVQPLQGRYFTAEEEQQADVAMVTETFWRKRLGGDPNVLQRSIQLDGVPHAIVAVVADQPLAWFGPNAEVFTSRPFQLPGIPEEKMMRGLSYLRVIGRLKPGVTPEQALAEERVLHQTYKTSWPATADNTWTPVQVNAADDITGNLRPAFGTLLAAVGFVLLIACSNVANLLLVRFSGRRREVAVRLALGSPRTEIVRLFLVESVTVSLLAATVGLLLAQYLLRLVPILTGENLQLGTQLALHPPVLAFALGLALLVGVAMGLYPALQGSGTDVSEALRDGGRGVSGSRGQQRFRKILVGAQVALSVVLLAGAGLLIDSFLRLYRQDAGFRAERLWIGAVGLPPAAYPDTPSKTRFTERLLSDLRNTPGVEAAAVGDSLPLNGNDSASPYVRAERGELPLNERPLGLTRAVAPGYFQALGVPLLRGRDFTDRDQHDAPLVVILSQATAKKLFPNEDPLGRRILFGTDNGSGLPSEVIGVVGDVRSVQLSKTNEIEFYRPLPQRPSPFLSIAVRMNSSAAAGGAVVRQALNELDNSLPVIQPGTMDGLVSASLGQERLLTALLGGFAAVAMLLAMVGIYGAVSYTVEQRQGELSLRMALGAGPGDVLRLVVDQGMRPVYFGLVAGLLTALGLGRLIATQLYGVSAHDPKLLSAALLGLGLIGLLACLIPAWRATRVQPVDALRAV